MARNDVYLNINALSPADAVVTGQQDMTAGTVPELVLGDTPTFNFYFTDNTNVWPSWAGNAAYTLTWALSDAVAGDFAPAATTGNATPITGGWSVILPLNSYDLVGLLNTKRVGQPYPVQNLWQQLRVTDPSGNEVTRAMFWTPIRYRAISDTQNTESASPTGGREVTVNNVNVLTTPTAAQFYAANPVPTSALGSAANGELLIGNGTGFTKATLTAGDGVTITNGSGSITISATDGDITLDDGTAAAPSLKFTVDTDTGIYRPSDNVLGISTGGVSRATFGATSAINGTTIPGSKTLVVTTDKLSALAATTSAELAGVISDETGSGKLVFATSPTLTTPILGTPQSGTLSSCTGLPISTGVSGLGTNVATFLATPSSANLASAVTDETGTGALVFANTPTLVTPNIGAATGTSVNLSGAGTFGGNLTVSGGTATITSASEADLYISKTGTSALSAYFYNQGTGSGGFGFYDGTAPRSVWEYSSAANGFRIKTSTLTADGNLTVNGTGPHSFKLGGTGSAEVSLARLATTFNLRSESASEDPLFTIQDSRANAGGFVHNARTQATTLGGNLTVNSSSASAINLSSGGIKIVSGNIGSDGSGEIDFNYNNSATGGLYYFGGGTTSKFNVSSAGTGTFAGNLTVSGTTIGLGVTPSAWSVVRAMQVENAAFAADGSNAHTLGNAYYDGSNWKRIAATNAVWYQVTAGAGAHIWYNAGSSTAGSTISWTQAMTLTSSGNLLVGTTTDGGQKLQVSGTAAISGALSIGNTVQTAASVASTHKVTISIGGVTYYLLATNV